MFIVGLFYVSWDVYAAANYHWWFNTEFTGNTKIAGLPLEEILFFITVPYSMIFLYEVFIFYFNDKINIQPPSRITFRIMSLLLFISALFMVNNAYSLIALISCSLCFLLMGNLYFSRIIPGIFWIFIAFSFVPFITVNYLLTSLPVVLYNHNAITGYRFLTIPAEDFFYSFSLVSFYLMIYLAAKDLLNKKIKTAG